MFGNHSSKQSNRLIWTVVALVAAYISLQVFADIMATKMVTVWKYVVPGGTLVYAFTFTVRDLVHKKLGKRWAQACIVVAGAVNVCMALFFLWLVKMPFPPFWANQEALTAILQQVPRIVLASIAAEMVSEFVDTEVYQLVWKKLGRRYQWARVAASNGVSAPLDSIVFALLAFGGVFPTAALVEMIIGQVLLKWLIGLISLPTIYLVKEGKGVEVINVECRKAACCTD